MIQNFDEEQIPQPFILDWKFFIYTLVILGIVALVIRWLFK
jgi:hypothetical protein